jgi:hypothetical protein
MIAQAAARAARIRLTSSTAAQQAAPAPSTMASVRDIAKEERDVISGASIIVTAVGIIGGAFVYATGWKAEAAQLNEKLISTEKQLANMREIFATKEEVAKVGTLVGKVEGEINNSLALARAAGENAALRVLHEKDAAIAGGKASIGGS